MYLAVKLAVDAAYVALAVIIIVFFTKRGFIDSLYRYGRTILAGVASFLLGPPVSKLVYEKWIYPWIFGLVSDKSHAVVSNTAEAIDLQALIDGLPFFVKKLVDREAIEAKYGNMEGELHGVVEDFSANVSSPLSWLLSNLIAYVAVFLLALLALFLIFKILDVVFKLPVLRHLNRILGFIFGVLSAFVVLAAITFLLGVAVSLFGSGSLLRRLIGSSYLFRFFNYISIFDLF